MSLAYADASPAVQRRIEERFKSRAPFPQSPLRSTDDGSADHQRLIELEHLLRQREFEMNERERALEDIQAKLAEREREMAELENLLLARERVLMAQRRAPTLPPFAASEEETAALEKLRADEAAQKAAADREFARLAALKLQQEREDALTKAIAELKAGKTLEA
jgi:hypothetical protein